MVDLDDATQIPESGPDDVEMEAGEDVAEGEEENSGAVGAEDTEDTNSTVNPQTIFLDHLKSPIVTLLIDTGDDEATISAHQSILTSAPYLAEQLSTLSPDSLSLELPDDHLDAVGCFLQYQYTGEYFPRRLASIPDGLEPDPSLPPVDDTGEQLLKHARVYTLAEKFGLPDLKSLAHSKIHRINSTVVGEIAYARYVYGNTPSDDITIRKPVAAFWATRSHVLRHEAEKEFKAMCLEFPQFGFDVLSLVLDQREKRTREREEEGTPGGGRGRKRMRPSVNI